MDKTTMSVRIRSANEKDLQSLVILAEEFIPGEADSRKRMEILKESLRNPDYKLFIAEMEEENVGFVDQWIIHDFAHGAKLSYIHNLYISSKHRRRGFASRLLQEASKYARNKKVSEIHITTRFDNKPAINLYRKYGLVKEHLELEKEFK